MIGLYLSNLSASSFVISMKTWVENILWYASPSLSTVSRCANDVNCSV